VSTRHLVAFTTSLIQNAPEESCPHGAFVCLCDSPLNSAPATIVLAPIIP